MPEASNLSEAKRALLEKLLRGNPSQASTDAGLITRRPHEGPVPLSFRQQQFWILSKMTPENPAYNEGVTIHLPSPLDLAALQQSMDEIIRRHEAWRTTFPLLDGRPVQIIHPPSPFPLPVVDLRHLPKSEQEAEALRIAKEDGRTPFDLDHGPMLRARLVRFGDEAYQMFLTIHHIIFDGFSIYQVFIPELTALYAAYTSGQPSPLPELAIQYADYALWQNQTLTGAALERHLTYWKQRLAGAPTELVLPSDHPRPQNLSSGVAVQLFTLPTHLNNGLKELCQREGVTLFMLLLAALTTLLYRYTGQEDIVVGTPTSGRSRPEIQNLLGVFINTLALRTELSGTLSFRELLKRAREVTLSALAHEDLPFEQVVKELQPERTLGQNPIFQVLLTLEPPIEELPAGWSAYQTVVQSGIAWFDLALTLEERKEGLIGRFEYNVNMFETATIERMAGHWLTLLEGVVANPDQPISSLPLLTEAERQQVLVEWNATQADYPRDQCVHHLFEQQVARAPEAVAVVYADTQLTYRQLNERANQLAHFLRKRGVGPGSLVGICVERSLEMPVGLLGILKAGGAYVPLDPNYPQDRLAFMLEDSQAAVLLTQQRLRSSLPPFSGQVICLDEQWEEIAQESQANPVSEMKSENLAYVIYTSGSTGKPKGVLIPHRGLVNHNTAFINAFHLQPTDRLLQFASLSFDTAGEELYPCWLSGATLVLRPAQFALTTAELLRLLEDERITFLNLPTAYWHTWVYELAESKTPLPETLRWVIVGGEQALPQRLALWQQHVDKRVRWSNTYGPTEATITATSYDLLRGQEEQEIGALPIGRPLANMQAYVLDAHLQPVPVGVPGELYIGGAGLAQGYLNRPELTAERFIPNPFSQEPGARLYKTGDLVRYLPDGNLEYLGRVDFQVKIRGYRIELGEIEAVLSKHPQVRETVVVAREDTPGEKRLVAYLVPAADEPPTSSALRSFLKEHLPDYMLPSAFVFLEQLPLTPNGKLNRRALPAPEGDRDQPGTTYVAPRTPTEEQLAAIWADLLGLKQVSIDENFFELGGHSLLAVRVLSQVRDTFHVELPLSSLFEAPTVAKLAVKIVQSQADLIEDDVTARLLAELEQLSDEEAQSILVTDTQASGG
jgi:amino acid adenylation domain-containing protein